MNFTASRTVDGAVEPISLEEAKRHLRVTAGDDDLLIKDLISAAREYAEAFHGKKYISTEATLSSGGLADCHKLDVLPASALVNVAAKDSDGIVHDVTACYELDTLRGMLLKKPDKPLPPEVSSLYWFNPVEIVYIAGCEPSKKTRQAMLLLVGHWYENREAVVVGGGVGFNSATPIPLGVDALLQQERHAVL